MIPQGHGGERPLGIPTIRDRVAQMAAKIVLEPIFEADCCACSYGFRPKCSAHQAIHHPAQAKNAGDGNPCIPGRSSLPRLLFSLS
jgi:RNA-directed DNA polymerase